MNWRRMLRLGLADYLAATDTGSQLEVTTRPLFQRPDPAALQIDRWRAWFFDVSLQGSRSGEVLTSSRSYDVSASANRTTEGWKIRLSTERKITASSFVIEDEPTIESRRADWDVQGLLVRSLSPHWSYGLTGSVVGSTYLNEDIVQ